ncbi:hypothetical protein MRB53_030451 [Persea americana]|uniref:Uncharacterized protein n=1 Tax=Persea americana TaxID=3435 RepID=A0ACC2KLM3_PERAE|nr:hypothetical protein MRB53_030451 [Persea americana]
MEAERSSFLWPSMMRDRLSENELKRPSPLRTSGIVLCLSDVYISSAFLYTISSSLPKIGVNDFGHGDESLHECLLRRHFGDPMEEEMAAGIWWICESLR